MRGLLAALAPAAATAQTSPPAVGSPPNTRPPLGRDELDAARKAARPSERLRDAPALRQRSEQEGGPGRPRVSPAQRPESPDAE